MKLDSPIALAVQVEDWENWAYLCGSPTHIRDYMQENTGMEIKRVLLCDWTTTEYNYFSTLSAQEQLKFMQKKMNDNPLSSTKN